jgi:hypothetical protein
MLETVRFHCLSLTSIFLSSSHLHFSKQIVPGGSSFGARLSYAFGGDSWLPIDLVFYLIPFQFQGQVIQVLDRGIFLLHCEFDRVINRVGL